jgi:Fur family ferric uptake transcriptional regulator
MKFSKKSKVMVTLLYLRFIVPYFLFEIAGIIKKEVSSDKKSVYSLNTPMDKHVLVCVKCHKKVIISGCPYHEANKKISHETGFQIIDHNTEIYGICPECLKKGEK